MKAKRQKPASRRKSSPRTRSKSTAKTTVLPVGALIPQEHGGALRNGGPNRGGTGRPKDEVREKLVGLAQGKGIPFLDELLEGNVTVRLVGKCRKCGTEGKPLSDSEASNLITRIGATVDQRLKGLDQALRYGVGTKDELDVRSHPEVQRFVMIHAKATREIVGDVAYQKIAERVRELAA